MTAISGHTRLVGLFATPIRHSVSPLIHNTAFQKLDIDAVYLAFEVGKMELPQAIEAIKTLGMLGANLSMPNKQLGYELVDERSKAAELIGAINTIVNHNGKLIGHITDGTGYMRSLLEKNIDIIGKKITLLGAGGAATAILTQAALDGVQEISVFNLNDNYFSSITEKLQAIQAATGCKLQLFDLADEERLKREVSTSALLANATGVGMKPLEGQCPIKDLSILREDLVVTDVIYTPRETELLRQAKKRGCQTMNGLGMLLYQGAAAFELWTGQKMPVEQVKIAINDL